MFEGESLGLVLCEPSERSWQMLRSLGLVQTVLSVPSLLGLALVLTCCVAAAQTETISIWPGVAPGSENWTEKESVMKGADT
jgi:hypothetical protein